jgi:hypothetical protein
LAQDAVCEAGNVSAGLGIDRGVGNNEPTIRDCLADRVLLPLPTYKIRFGAKLRTIR